jgi:hypothetical protein
MTITLRSTKGSELTFSELDGNFTDLDNRLSLLDSGAGNVLKRISNLESDGSGNPIASAIAALQGQVYIDSADVTSIVDINYIQSLALQTLSIDKYYYTAVAGATVFTGADDNGATLAYDPLTAQVYLNGLLQQDGVDYNAVNGTSVIFTAGVDSGNLVTITNLKIT